MSDSLFTKIIRGDIPSYKIYEDDKTYAFLDIHPKQPGHVLVIPKSEVEFVWDLIPTDYQALMNTVQKVAKHVREVLQVPYVGEQVVGTDVPHAHIHLIPFSTTAEFQAPPDQGEPNEKALAEMAQKLAF